MTTALIIFGGYALIAVIVALVAAYKCAFDDRLAGRETDWDESGVIVIGLGAFWVIALLVVMFAWVFRRIANAIDTAASVAADEQRARQEGEQ